MAKGSTPKGGREKVIKRVKVFKCGERIPGDAYYLKTCSEWVDAVVNGKETSVEIFLHFYEVFDTEDRSILRDW